MQLLSRKVGQSIMIGDEITCTVLGVQNGMVRLAIAAPNETSVHREEIYMRIQTEQKHELEEALIATAAFA